MNRLLLSVLISVTLPYAAFAADQVISLKDGSQIRGQLVGVSPGFYTVHTQTMGDIKIETSNISSITDASLSTPSNGTIMSSAHSGSGDIKQHVASAQAKIMNNPQAMADIKEMMEDPELMKLLTDPSIAQAATNNDVESLQNNPKTQALINNPKMQAFMKKMNNSNNSSY